MMIRQPVGGLSDDIRPVVSAAYDLARGLSVEEVADNVEARFAYLGAVGSMQTVEKALVAQMSAKDWIDWVKLSPTDRSGLPVPTMTGSEGFVDISVQYADSIDPLTGEQVENFRIVRMGFVAGEDMDQLWQDIVSQSEVNLAKYGLGQNEGGLVYGVIGAFYQ